MVLKGLKGHDGTEGVKRDMMVLKGLKYVIVLKGLTSSVRGRLLIVLT